MTTQSDTSHDIDGEIYLPSDVELLRLRDEAAQLRADRDALAKALRDCIMWVNVEDQGAPEYIAQWREALAKHGGAHE